MGIEQNSTVCPENQRIELAAVFPQEHFSDYTDITLDVLKSHGIPVMKSLGEQPNGSEYPAIRVYTTAYGREVLYQTFNDPRFMQIDTAYGYSDDVTPDSSLFDDILGRKVMAQFYQTRADFCQREVDRFRKQALQAFQNFPPPEGATEWRLMHVREFLYQFSDRVHEAFLEDVQDIQYYFDEAARSRAEVDGILQGLAPLTGDDLRSIIAGIVDNVMIYNSNRTEEEKL